MFDDYKTSFINFITSRIFVLLAVFLGLFGVLLGRVFLLQIIRGEEYADSFTMTIRKEINIASTRGKIYDRNGEILADNVLSYAVTIEDNGSYQTTRERNVVLNRTIRRVIDIVESHGDSVISDFGIIWENGRYAFTQEGTALLRFKADVYGRATIDELKPEEYTATAAQMMDYLCGDERYYISWDAFTPEQREHYGIEEEDISPQEKLKIVTVRYAIGLNSYKRYVATTIASDVCDETVAEILENMSELQGVDIAQSSLRVYSDPEYFASLIGYIGKPSQEELDELQKQNENYELNDIVGKAGIEQYMETALQGTKGSRTIYVDSVGNVMETENEVQPQSGQDVYLTIDKNLQKAVYDILEQQLAGILLSKIRNMKEYVAGPNSSAASILIPIYDVYYAMINHHIIDTTHFTEPDATELERSVQQRFETELDKAVGRIMDELHAENPKPYQDLPIDMKNYMSHIVSDILMGNNVLMSDAIDKKDETYIAWTTDEVISLKEYLEYAISMNWVDVSELEAESSYLNSQEIYEVLMDYISTELENDVGFHTMLYKYILLDDIVTGKEICLLLYDQGVLEYDEETIEKLQNGSCSAYSFMTDKIKSLEITPAMLALEPCTAACVITDPNTGDTLACVSYPGYDNNRLTNTMDSAYFAELNRDQLTSPLYSKATQERTAPGSTMKPVMAVAGLEEGYISPSETIHATGVFTDAYGSPTCWIYNQYHGSHGNINVVDAIRESCNYFFYEVGFRLGGGRTTGYSSDRALELEGEYASQFGLDAKSGMEIPESDPKLSDSDGVRSAIGQGTFNLTVSQLARYVSSIANRGTVYNLTLIDKVADSDGNTIEDYSASVYNNINIADSSWNVIQEGMHEVAQNTAAFENLDLTIAGKTGTAQQSKRHPNHALFIGYAPYENPQIGIAIRIANGYTSANAASMASDIFRYYFNLTDRDELLSGTASEATTAVIND